MHIKRVSIQGFLSYKSVLKLQEFSPQHNIIVGRNGAGKSNFFNAISFVLGDDYSNMGASARNDLLHTGAGASVVRAFVEIVFDNSDGQSRLASGGAADSRSVSEWRVTVCVFFLLADGARPTCLCTLPSLPTLGGLTP
jgi:chromosome segregation ATPase